MIVKLIFLVIMILCGLVAYLIKFFIPELKYKNNPMTRIRIIVRVRVVCYIIMLLLLFICMFI